MTIRGIDAIQFPRDIDHKAADMIKGLCTAGKNRDQKRFWTQDYRSIEHAHNIVIQIQQSVWEKLELMSLKTILGWVTSTSISFMMPTSNRH